MRKHKKAMATVSVAVLVCLSFLAISFGTLSQGPPSLPAVLEILRRNEHGILNLPGVVGMGITRESGTLMFLVAINPEEGEPQLPVAIEGIPLRVIETEEFGFAVGTTPSDHQQPFPLPVPMGVQTENAVACANGTGTLGFRVRDRFFPNPVG
jgi:hypothetical protein